MKQHILRLGKTSLVYGLGTMLTRFISLLLLPLFTNYLTPADYGVLALLALLGSMAQPIFSLGLGAGIGPCYFEGNNETRKATTIWTAFALLLISAMGLILLGYGCSHSLSRLIFQTPTYNRLIVLYLIKIAISILYIPFALRLQFEEKAIAFVTLTAISTLITIALNVLMVVGLKQGVEGMVTSQLVGMAITATLFLVFVARPLRFRWDWGIGKELLHLGLPLVPSFAFLFILAQGNRYILQWFNGLEAVGIYSVGFNFGAFMGLLVGAFTTAWYPFFMTFVERWEEAKPLFGRIFTYYVYGFGALCLLFFIYAKPVSMLMTQPAFHTAYIITGMAASAQYFTGMFSLLLPGVYFAREVKYISVMQGIATCLSVALNLILIPWLGLLGAGIALAGGYLAMAILQYAWNRYREDRYLQVQYEWKRVLNFTLLFFGVGVISLIPRAWDLWAEIAIALVATTILLIILYLMLGKEDSVKLRKLLTQFQASFSALKP